MTEGRVFTRSPQLEDDHQIIQIARAQQIGRAERDARASDPSTPEHAASAAHVDEPDDVAMSASHLQGVVNDAFRMSGLSLRRDAMAAVLTFLDRSDDANAALTDVLDALDTKSLSSSIVGADVIADITSALDRKRGVFGGPSTPAGGGSPGDDDLNDDDANGGGGGRGASASARREDHLAAMLDASDGITIVDAFDVPRFTYDTQRKVFHEDAAGPRARSVCATSADSKIELYRERFLLLQQRLARHRMFTKPSFAAGARASERTYCEITPLTGLLGCAHQTRYVMGCLSQLEDDRFFLEDLTGQIQVDVTNAATSSGLYTENCIVVAEGEVRKRDGVFEVRALGFPPAESREETRSATNHVDFFGAGRLSPSDVSRLTEDEAAASEDMFVVLADVWLDKEATFKRLRTVFEGFDSLETIPGMFVFMGDFTSEPFGPTKYDYSGYAAGFDQLATLIEDFPRLRQEARWVFVPGPGDPGVAAALPRPPLLPSLTGRLRDALPRVAFASNPARIRYKSQDLVFMREDLQSRMRRNCILPPTELDDVRGKDIRAKEKDIAAGGGGSAADAAFDAARDDEMDAETDADEGDDEPSEWERRPLFRHLAATLVQQAHLAPLPLAQLPVYWEHDHAMRLYPAPHCLVLGDRTEQQALAKFEDTELVNPGCFADDGSFAVYRPATREVEFSAVP